jgi:hypothetical protein
MKRGGRLFSAGYFFGDGGPATAAQLNAPMQVAPLPGGGFLVADSLNNRIRRVSRRGIITTVADTGERGCGGDRGPATQAKLTAPTGVTVLTGGGFLIADSSNYRVPRFAAGRNHNSGRERSVCAERRRRRPGDEGGSQPSTADLADTRRRLPDRGNARVRNVSRSGRITTVAGTGRAASSATAVPRRPRSCKDPEAWR